MKNENAQVENQTVETTEKPARRLSNHINHPSCVELRELLAQVDINTVTVVRGKKNFKQELLITDKERQLVETFISTDYNIKKTGELCGFSHTNVWQRLYGNGKTVNPSKGVLGKLRAYVNNEYTTEIPAQAAPAEQATEAPAEEIA